MTQHTGHALTGEEELLRNTVRDFALNEIRPAAEAHDRWPDPERAGITAVLEKALSPRGLGLGMALVPTEYGGLGYGLRELALMAEELAWGDLGFINLAMGNMHAAPALAALGSEAQKRRWFPALAGSDGPGILAAVGLTEPDTGAAVFSGAPGSGMRATARRDRGDYVINGRKCFINNAGIAGLYLIWARTPAGSDPVLDSPVSVFLVPAGTPGLEAGKQEDLMGIRSAWLGEVVLEDCRVPAESLLGPEGGGLTAALSAMPLVSVLLGAAAVGLARAAYEAAKTYAGRRVTESVPIIQHQAVSHKLVDMDMMIEATRSLVMRAAGLYDEGGRDFKLPLMCKVFGSKTARRVTSDAVEIVGAYGYTRDYPVEKYMRDAKALQVSSPDLVMRNHLAFFS